MPSNLWESRITPKIQKVWGKAGSTAMAHIYSPGGEKIGFIGVMELKSVMETDQHSRNSGNGS